MGYCEDSERMYSLIAQTLDIMSVQYIFITILYGICWKNSKWQWDQIEMMDPDYVHLVGCEAYGLKAGS